LEQPQGYVV